MLRRSDYADSAQARALDLALEMQNGPAADAWAPMTEAELAQREQVQAADRQRTAAMIRGAITKMEQQLGITP